MRRIGILVLLVVGPSLARLPPARAVEAPARAVAEPVPVELRRLLVERKYSQLAETLAAKQAAAERSVLVEDSLWEAFLSFSLPDRNLAVPLDEWVRASGDSWVPRLARAYHFQKMGFSARDDAAFGRTTPQQMDAMTAYLDMAEVDFKAAATHNPRLAMAHEGLIGIGQYRGDEKMVETAYQAALRLSPASFEIRAARIHSLRPRWGGSYASMLAVATEARQHFHTNPRLKALPGYVAVDEADEAARAGNGPRALQLLSQAISTAPEPAVLAARGWLHHREDRFPEALADFNRAIELGPHGWWYVNVRLPTSHYYKARCLVKAERYDDAIQEFERAIQLDPSDDGFRFTLDLVRQMRERYKPR
jgi:tetratricopeptide (TPR) repeat protein